jgi:hypothetical protein
MAPPIYATRCLRRFHKQRGSIRYHNLSAQWPVFLSDNAPCCTVTLLDKNSPSAPFSVSQPNTRGSFHCITCSHLQTVPGPIWSSVLVGLVDTETTAVYIAMQIICTTLCIHLLHVVSLRAALTIFTDALTLNLGSGYRRSSCHCLSFILPSWYSQPAICMLQSVCR